MQDTISDFTDVWMLKRQLRYVHGPYTVRGFDHADLQQKIDVNNENYGFVAYLVQADAETASITPKDAPEEVNLILLPTTATPALQDHQWTDGNTYLILACCVLLSLMVLFKVLLRGRSRKAAQKKAVQVAKPTEEADGVSGEALIHANEPTKENQCEQPGTKYLNYLDDGQIEVDI